VPLPLLSAGGSSLLATLMGLGIALGARRKI
jgi:cell division protein FtsW (lipid II flippase)